MITELTRIEPVHLARLEAQGVFTTGILLETSSSPTRQQSLADHVKATTNDVRTWRDEALMLNLAGVTPHEHQLFIQAGIEGLADLLAVDLSTFKLRLLRAATELNWERPADLLVEGWWEQARTLEEA
jgi:DNA-directed RNA polymerase specialized sigma24 family protein